VLVCFGSKDYRCWNSLFVNGAEAARRIVAAVLQALIDLPGFDAVFGAMVRQHAAEFEGRQETRRQQILKETNEVEQSLANLFSVLEKRPESAALIDRMDELEIRQSELQRQLKQLDLEPHLNIALPDAEELRRQAVTSLQHLATNDPESCHLLRQLIPQLLIVPYQYCDERDIVPRAEVTVSLTSLLPSALRDEASAEVFRKRIVVDLTNPPQRVQYCNAATALKARGMKERDIAAQLGIAQSAVQAALKIGRIMTSRGLVEPLIRLTALPRVTNNLRRHKQPRFRFEPLDGFPREE
jgi:hypothetical protein